MMSKGNDDFKFLADAFNDLQPEEIRNIPLKEFVREAWSVVEPTVPFIEGWHIDAICEHLEAATKREFNNLLITIPPRHSKSRLTSIFWPAWAWTQSPGEKFLCSSYSSELSTEHSIHCRRLVQSKWYKDNWGKVHHLIGDQNRKQYFENDMGGYRIATSVGGTGTGLGGSVILIDDPHNVKEAPSKLKREAVITWWSQVMSTRLNPPVSEGLKVIIMQRCHERDLAGYLITQEAGFEHLNLPTEYVPSRSTVTSIGWEDPREIQGELLWPKVFGVTALKTIKRELGSYGFAAQHQQTPSPPKGGLIHRDWWGYYDEIPVDPKGRLYLDEIIQSWDMTFKSSDSSDYVVGQVWGRKGVDKLLLDQVRRRLSFPQTIKAVKGLTDKWPETSAILVEDKANGPAVISQLQREIAGLIPVDPKGDKVGRLSAVSAQIESGNVFLPRRAKWVDDYVEEFAAATPDGGGQFWDQIDSTSQALLRMSKGKGRLTWGRKERAEHKVPHHKSGPKRKVTFGRRLVVVGKRRSTY
jgi:predicted phage terminase large subunit-like protein